MRARDLETLLARAGQPGRVVRVRQRPSPYRSTHALEEASLRFEDGRHLNLILKAYGNRAILDAPAATRPRFVTDPYRELWAYEHVVVPLDAGAPRFYGTLEPEGPESGRLVLERLEGDRLAEVGAPGAWAAAAAWLARFHGRGEAVASRLAATGHPLHQEPALHRRWLARARHYALHDGTAHRLETLERITPAYHCAVEHLSEAPNTVLHGEFYASNIVISRDSGGWVVRPIDWESLAVGPAVLDLAALMSGRWVESRRAAILRTYEDGLEGGGVAGEVCGALLAAARLVIAVQWLGWSPDWTPPAEHAHDWLGEAVHAAADVRS